MFLAFWVSWLPSPNPSSNAAKLHPNPSEHSAKSPRQDSKFIWYIIWSWHIRHQYWRRPEAETPPPPNIHVFYFIILKYLLLFYSIQIFKARARIPPDHFTKFRGTGILAAFCAENVDQGSFLRPLRTENGSKNQPSASRRVLWASTSCLLKGSGKVSIKCSELLESQNTLRGCNCRRVLHWMHSVSYGPYTFNVCSCLLIFVVSMDKSEI